MNKLLIALVGLTALTMVAADCPNACSGNGDCQTNWDFCLCYHGFIGADCSERLCQFGLSWIDTPQGDLNHDNNLNSGYGDSSAATGARPAGTPDMSALNPMWRFEGWWERHPAALYGTNDQRFDLPFYVRAQEGHFYAECSNRGICDRSTGLCDCLTGYEGAACNRTVCQSDCSGHGTCQTVDEVTPDHLHYRLWDSEKTRLCVCDGGYFGMDCSQRACMKNDDPLTITTTTEDYNDGLTEANEIQVLEVRCPYNGDMLDPRITMTYTDVQFGDEYETAQFNPADTSAANEAVVLGYLKGLPNQVLADYVVDGVTVVNKVVSVAAMELEADNFYRWTVTFHEHLGDVPMLQGTSYFKCRGGAEVNTVDPDTGTYNEENFVVDFIGDGPAMYLELDGPITVANPDTWDVTVKDKNGNNIADPNPATSTAGITVTFDVAPTASTFSETNMFTREVAKVTVYGAEGVTHADRVWLNIKIHVDPVVTVRNSMYTIDAFNAFNTGSRSIPLSVTGAGATDLTVQGVATPAYDLRNILEIVDGANQVARWILNDEFMAFVTIPTSAADMGANILDGATPAHDLTGTFHTFPATFDDFTIDDQTQIGAGADGEIYHWHHDKTPVFSEASPLRSDGSTAVDTFTVHYDNQMAPTHAISLVLRVVETSGNPDKYEWKVAGDTQWIQDQTLGVGFDIQDNVARSGETEDGNLLGELDYYLVQLYPDDPMRAGLRNVRIAWTEGAENDERICASQTTNTRRSKYYIQIGSAGLNDSPECSDRGVCDYGSGLCRCFKGYAGIDCSEQNALSAGFTGATSAF